MCQKLRLLLFSLFWITQIKHLAAMQESKQPPSSVEDTPHGLTPQPTPPSTARLYTDLDDAQLTLVVLPKPHCLDRPISFNRSMPSVTLKKINDTERLAHLTQAKITGIEHETSISIFHDNLTVIDLSEGKNLTELYLECPVSILYLYGCISLRYIFLYSANSTLTIHTDATCPLIEDGIAGDIGIDPTIIIIRKP